MSKQNPSPHLVIVGGGASGAIALIKAMHTLPANTRITIIEPHQELGLGRAYSTSYENHLLNVPKEKMSIYAEDPLDFSQWLKSNALFPSDPTVFVPRKHFGAYLTSKIKSLDHSRYLHLRERVRSVSKHLDDWKIVTESATEIHADCVILATGFSEKIETDLLQLKGKLNLERILQPYEVEKISKISNHEKVLVVGSGLTAADVFLQLRNQGNENMHFISRHGLTPIPHPSAVPPQSFRIPSLVGMSPLQVLRVFRSFQEIKNGEFIHLIQQVRDQAKHVWTCWTYPEKKRFLAHLKPYWEIVRHRIPQPVAHEWKKATDENHLTLSAARIVKTESAGIQFTVTTRPRGQSATQENNYDWIVLATDVKINQDLEDQRPGFGPKKCALGMGYSSERPDKMWMLGPSSKSSQWEITAIPDITLQADQVMSEISESLKTPHSRSRFSDHPYRAGETYLEHFTFAFGLGLVLLKDALLITIHAIFPFLYTDTLSDHLRTSAQNLTRRRTVQFKVMREKAIRQKQKKAG